MAKHCGGETNILPWDAPVFKGLGFDARAVSFSGWERRDL